jgi:hypothetical protein
MSLIDAKKFLQCLNKHFPILDSGIYTRHHALMLENDKFLLMLHIGPDWQTFFFNEEDFNKDPEDIVLELKQVLKKE